MAQSRRFCFTLNNPTAGESQLLTDLLQSEHVKYGIVGRETAATGTPHLQGFVIFDQQKRLNAVKRLIGQRYHLEPAKGTSQQAADYCKKESDYDEYGTFPSEAGKRNDFVVFQEWVAAQTTRPTERKIATTFPALFGRYRVSTLRMADLLWSPPARDIGTLREWQRTLEQELDLPPDDRKIKFVVDPVGNAGKSWFIRYYSRKHPDTVQRLGNGKRDDLAYALDPTKRTFIFDVPRGKLEFISYALMEDIKNMFVFSGKYDSTAKELDEPAHVVIFTNEEPDYNKLTADRYDVFRANND